MGKKYMQPSWLYTTLSCNEKLLDGNSFGSSLFTDVPDGWDIDNLNPDDGFN